LRDTIPVAMPFHFKKSESPVKAIRRVGRELVGEARGRLRSSRQPAAVHDVRKEIKKLRAVFQLVRGEIQRDDYRHTVKALRQAAGRLAALRDARVTLQAFELLAGGAATRRFPKIHKALQRNFRRAARRFRDDDSVAAAKRSLQKVNRCVNGLEIKAAGWAAIEPGLRQSFQRDRRTWEIARRQPSPENFHAWRKPVKICWHQLRLLCPAWPAAAHARMEKLERLGERLGDDHDLFLLKQFAAAHATGAAGEVAALNRLIESRQKKLRTAALKLGARLYAETPAAVCARLKADWNAWRGEPGRR
jgi:CHAD domain-containing protein